MPVLATAVAPQTWLQTPFCRALTLLATISPNSRQSLCTCTQQEVLWLCPWIAPWQSKCRDLSQPKGCEQWHIRQQDRSNFDWKLMQYKTWLRRYAYLCPWDSSKPTGLHRYSRYNKFNNWNYVGDTWTPVSPGWRNEECASPNFLCTREMRPGLPLERLCKKSSFRHNACIYTCITLITQ